MTIHRAYSTIEIEIKDVTKDSNGKRTFKGIASTPTPDRLGDVVEPEGAKFKLPLPLLWQHDSKQPIGWVTTAKATKEGIFIEGEIADIPEEGTLKNRLTEAWLAMKHKLVRGLSIGFRSIEAADIKGTWAQRFIKWDWLELSVVTIPANVDASITSIKSIDRELVRAVSGPATHKSVEDSTTKPGVPGTTTLVTKGNKMNTKEALAAFEAKRAAAVASMSEIMAKSATEGATLSDEDETKYEDLSSEVKKLDKHIARLRDQDALESADADAKAKSAKPVTEKAATSEEESLRVRQGDGVIRVNPNIEKGTAFVRLGVALARSKGNIMQAYEMAKQFKDSTPQVVSVLEMMKGQNTTTGMYTPEFELGLIKTAVAAGNTTDSAWASPLVQYNNLASEFVSLLRPATILGKLNSLRKVPFNIRFGSVTSGTTMSWVGQALGKPVSKMQMATNTLGFAKAAGIVVITKELAMLSSPSAEAIVRDDMIAQMAQFLDQQFIDPGVAAVANVSPASITNGATAVQATGSTLATFEADVASAMTILLNGEIPFSSLAWVMTPYTAMKIGMLRDAGGDTAYPTVSASGGTLYGIPVITSNSVPHSTSAGSIVVLLAQPEIFLADEGGLEIDVSDQASIEMVDNPGGIAASLVSLWQNNLIGLRAERMINWQRRRSTAVVYIDNLHL